MSHRARTLLAAALFAAALPPVACAVPPPTSPPPVITIARPAPPKPGDSITASKLCSCRSCERVECCAGAEEEAPTARCESLDFSTEGCGLAIESCESRCFEHSWRVPVSVECAAKRPERCCEAAEG